MGRQTKYKTSTKRLSLRNRMKRVKYSAIRPESFNMQSDTIVYNPSSTSTTEIPFVCKEEYDSEAYIWKMPAAMTVLNPAIDEDSDENLSLDLHMSDNEDSEGITPKGQEDDIPMDVEDEILNKFETKEKCSELTNGETADEKATSDETAVGEESVNKTEDEPTLNGETDDACDAGTTGTDETKNEVQTEEKSVAQTEEESESQTEKKSDTQTVEKVDEDSKDSNKSEPVEEEALKKPDDEGEDLLLVMDEKTTEVDDTEFTTAAADEDETSGSEEAKGDKEGGDTPPEEPSEDNTDSNQDDNMDIEETGIEGSIELTENVLNVSAPDDLNATDDTLNATVIENVAAKDVNDCNKENVAVNGEEVAAGGSISVLQAILTKGSLNTDSVKAPVKRQLSDGDSDVSEESYKKIKLLEEPVLKKLAGFKQFMLDKSLKNLTRDQLEVFCIQKMCECIVHKSEIGELKMKIKTHEQLLDALRKEAVLLSKQTRDLNIVHQKVMQDVVRIQENTDKPLIVPKITRSVGLQAVVRDETRRKVSRTSAPGLSPVKMTPPQKPVPRSPLPTNVVNRTPPPLNNRFGPRKVMQTVPALMRAKMPVNGTAKKTEPGKGAGVIDLTDEDDKKTTMVGTTTTTTSNGVKVNAPNNHKFVVLPTGQTMLVKLNPANNVVVSQPVRTVQSQNGAIRAPTQVLRGGAPTSIRASTPVRAQMGAPRGRSPAQAMVRPRAPYPSVPPVLKKHPAPLPVSPSLKTNVYSKKPVPPKPQLMLNKTSCGTGIVLSWKMPYKLEMFEEIASYQLYAYQETKMEPRTDSWGKIGDVKALELPMAVTLTQFAVGNRYYFAVRAVDILTRHGLFSDYQTILL